MGFSWPAGFERIPDEPWARAPVEELARKYDTVENHGWYSNLDPTVADVLAALRPNARIIDYSGGTGIFLERLFATAGDLAFGALDADSSPKFLRLALEKFRGDARVAFRLLPYRKDLGRLAYLDEVLPPKFASHAFDGLVSTNAIHLYTDLNATIASWRRVLKEGSLVFVQSGNIRGTFSSGKEDGGEAGWIIDDTVEAVNRRAQSIVAAHPSYAAYRDFLSAESRMRAHDELRRKFFPSPRSFAVYEDAFRRAGFELVDVKRRRIPVRTKEWEDFLSVYHEGILGWVGGSPRVEGHEPGAGALADRQRLLREALEEELHGRRTFDASWTYATWKATGTSGRFP
ncbi:MAG: class I SAM-dependent methyltransferase [Thermoplasmatota archaeon]